MLSVTGLAIRDFTTIYEFLGYASDTRGIIQKREEKFPLPSLLSLSYEMAGVPSPSNLLG